MKKLVFECRLTGFDSKDDGRLSRVGARKLVVSAGRGCQKSGVLGPPSSSPSHVISQRDLEHSLSWSLTIATINITNCPGLTAPRRAKGFTSPRLLSDTRIAGVVAFSQDYSSKAPGLRTRDLSRDLQKRRRLSNSVSAISASLSRPSAIYLDAFFTTTTA